MNTSLLFAAVVEGLTEFLPVSSTAHLILLGKFFAVDLADPYIKFYILFIQVGALLAGILLFSRRILTDRSIFVNVCVSFFPTAVAGFALYSLFKHLLEGNLLLMALVLGLGGVLLMYVERVITVRIESGDEGKNAIDLRDAFLIGCAQSLAIVPGVSRSGSTIVAGILLGIRKAVIIEYTFLLALPTLGAAVLYDAYKSREILAAVSSWNELLAGFLIAGVSAFLTLAILKKYLPVLSFAWFGWYRIVLSIIILFALL